VERAIDRIMSSFRKENGFRIREVREKDCYDLWIWRNHPEVRRWSFDKKEIDYRHHLGWFRKMSESKHSTIYVAESKKSERLGQVRFQKYKEGPAYVNINLNPDFLKRGLGNKILREATLRYLGENRKVMEVRAEILEGNTTSKKAFQKAGYRFYRHTSRDGQWAALCRYTRD
jgi:RimJ/RimL family protein N-acetyltransferase